MTAASLTIRAPAKINLFLKVLARASSGFHQIETLFVAVSLEDRIRLTRAGAGVRLTVEGAELGPEHENLVYRAAEQFLLAADGGEGVDIHLEKRIPAGAGLGGGSSDAGAALRGLNALFGEPLAVAALLDLAGRLGSDVPFFTGASGWALGWGRGTRLLQMPAPEARWVLLALPGFQVNTGEAYGALADRRGSAHRAVVSSVTLDELGDWAWLEGAAINDFEPVMFERHPELASLRDALRSQGASVSLLSGSGSTVFGLFAGQAAARGAAQALRERFPGVRFEPVTTIATLPLPGAAEGPQRPQGPQGSRGTEEPQGVEEIARAHYSD